MHFSSEECVHLRDDAFVSSQLAVDDDVDDHAASERVRADIIDSSRLVEGENGFEVEGQHASCLLHALKRFGLPEKCQPVSMSWVRPESEECAHGACGGFVQGGLGGSRASDLRHEVCG